MNSGFVITSGKHNYRPFRNQPLGVLYLLTILEQHFGERLGVSLIDLRGVSEEDAIYHVPQKDIYFYSVASIDFPETKNIVKKIREAYPKARHIAGGPHIEIFPEESLKCFDAISLGEGEESIKRIVEDVFKSDLKRIYRQQEAIDLNAYPYASRKYLPKPAVVEKGMLGGEYMDLPGTAVLFSRGCPFKCHFCSNLTFGPTRFRSPELIIQEIEYLKSEYGIRALALKDDNSIPIIDKVARPVLEAIAKTGVKWRGQSRANGVSPEMVKLAKESGCIEIAVGLESASQTALDAINKRINLDLAKKYLQVLKEVGIERRMLIILGLPGEPDDIAQRTIDFIKETEPSSVLLSLLCPLPGSEIFKNPQKFGIKIDTTIPFDKYFTVFGRFSEDEKPTPIFEYEEMTPFGKGRKMDKIIDDYMMVQKFLRENKLNF
jgi:anaerobic magnesium-protoporphyrin IX monomethyl ester cyclase